jgi:hypothetical protein
MSDREEADRRIEAARQQAARQAQTREFLEGLTKDDELVKPVYNPEAFVFREKLRGQAERGELKRTGCRHPFDRLEQYVDDDPLNRRNGRSVNLFECGVCHLLLWLVDPWGEPVSDA